jgi:hypothetical protein
MIAHITTPMSSRPSTCHSEPHLVPNFVILINSVTVVPHGSGSCRDSDIVIDASKLFSTNVKG